MESLPGKISHIFDPDPIIFPTKLVAGVEATIVQGSGVVEFVENPPMVNENG